MKIRCKVCGEYFYPDEETLALMSEGYLIAGDINICDECWEMLNHSNSEDLADMISDADPGL
jgi:formylmethanofuran dehydrogenase subunit E